MTIQSQYRLSGSSICNALASRQNRDRTIDFLVKQIFCSWKKKHSGVGVAELQHLRELERENARLKRMYAGQALELTAIEDVLTRKSLARFARRAVVTILTEVHQLPVQRACQIPRCSRAAFRRAWRNDAEVSPADADAPEIAALQAVIEQHGRWGFTRFFDGIRVLGNG